jgi:hypothetical protein
MALQAWSGFGLYSVLLPKDLKYLGSREDDADNTFNGS